MMFHQDERAMATMRPSGGSRRTWRGILVVLCLLIGAAVAATGILEARTPAPSVRTVAP